MQSLGILFSTEITDLGAHIVRPNGANPLLQGEGFNGSPTTNQLRVNSRLLYVYGHVVKIYMSTHQPLSKSKLVN